MQEEILALIKSLQAGGSRIAFTSSFAPRELHRMDSRLISLFCSGLLAHMANPTFETRRAILREKACLHQVVLPDQVSELLATRITGDVRRLESCLSTLVFKARLLNRLISLDMAAEIARQYADGQSVFGMDDIIRAVCGVFRLSLPRLASRSRKSELVQARGIAYYLARKHTELSLEEIGGCFNRRHSSVVKGISMLEREMRRETPLGRRLSDAVKLVERDIGV
jgi:chromosomal replication initiator protein